jgi:hypothetical protein
MARDAGELAAAQVVAKRSNPARLTVRIASSHRPARMTLRGPGISFGQVL